MPERAQSNGPDSERSTGRIETAGRYRIDDARALPELLPRPAAVAAVDLPWARPHRNGVGICYETFDPDDGLWEFVDAVHEALEPGGWAIFDADDWLLPRLLNYLRDDWGDVAATYDGGGYRHVAAVVYASGGGRGQYFRSGGYPVVLAHKGATDRTTTELAYQVTDRPPRTVRQRVDWESLKPIAPYETWIDAVTEPGDLVAVPCAGTAPAAIAAERLGLDWVAVDYAPGARSAFQERASMQLGQRSIGEFGEAVADD